MNLADGTPDDVTSVTFEVIAESLLHIVWLADATGACDYLNEVGMSYTGLSREAHYGWSLVRVVHPDDAERARIGWEHPTRTATPYILSHRIRRRDGAFRWHEFRALPVRAENGRVRRWIGTADDL